MQILYKELIRDIVTSPKLLLVIGVAIPIISLSVFAIYKYNSLQTELANLRNNPTQSSDISKSELKSLLDKLGQLMEIPQNEEPTVATITDTSKLKDQPFFEKAQNGDKVIIFTSSKKAILYRPASNKIIDVSPINVDTPTVTPGSVRPSGNPSITLIPTLVPLKANITILNGTETSGLATKMERSLKKIYPDITVITKDFAQRKNYIKTLVIDSSGVKKTEAQTLAEFLKGEISILPKNEVIPTPEPGSLPADITVIIGQDYKPL